MSKLVWDEVGKRTYETGVDHGILYLVNSNGVYDQGVSWSGLTGVTESPSGAEDTALYADNIKYLNMKSNEEFGATITAYTYPDEFGQCDGSAELATGVLIGQQQRKPFGLAYRTRIGSDTEGDAHGYKLHLIYGCSAAPSERNYQTVNDSPEAIEFSWEIKTTPVNVTNFRPVSSITIDSTKADAGNLATLLGILEGTDGTVSYDEFTGTEFEQGVTYYERSGEEGHYVYTPTTDTEYDSSKTYYTRVETGGTTARLPLPDEVKRIMTAAG